MGRYAGELRDNGGKLMLSGVGQNLLDQLRRTETTKSVPEDNIFMATDTLGESTRNALSVAHAWLAETSLHMKTNGLIAPPPDLNESPDG